MKILVIGGAGFIGSNLVERLVKEKHQVIVLDNLFLGTKDNLSAVKSKIKFIEGDISTRKIDEKLDAIFAMGNYSSAPMFKTETPKKLKKTIAEFVDVLELARKNNASLIYASTSSIQGPRTMYSGLREIFETLASMYYSEYNFNSIGLRFFSVYGGDKFHESHKKQYANMITQIYKWMQKNENLNIYMKNTTRDFIHVLDVVDACVCALKYKKDGASVFEIGTGKAFSFEQIIQTIAKFTGLKPRIQYINNPLKNYVKATCSKKYKKSEKELGWKPKISLEKGISLMIS